MLRGRVVVRFCSEAIKKEEELAIAPSKIEIFSQQDTPLSVPATSWFVTVASNDDLPVCVWSVLSSLNAFSAGRQLEQGRRRNFH